MQAIGPVALSPSQAEALSTLLTSAFPDSPGAWSPSELQRMSRQPGAGAFVLETGPHLAGILLLRMAADEAEVLTLAVASSHRRRGGASQLFALGLNWLRNHHVDSLYLEVSAANSAAIGFYERHGFTTVGTRPAYYRTTSGGCEDAYLMKLPKVNKW
jgi:ribosomal-protein-alanine N-acetyltransferase